NFMEEGLVGHSGHVGHSGNVDMSKHGVSKSTITEMQLEEARVSIEYVEEEGMNLVNEEGLLPENNVVEEQISGDLNLVAVQIVNEVDRRTEENIMAKDRNRIKG
ncbi:hypothetical protein MKX03_031347, partial [Papaver bracteatum]